MSRGGARRGPLHRSAAVVLAAVAIVVAGGAAVTRAVSAGGDPPCRTALIPAYLTPERLAALAERPVAGRLVVLNPASGPGAAAQPAYRRVVEGLQRGGTRVLGYVHTSYGERPRGDVLADAARYRAWYGVDGVFLDEAARTTEQLAYYRAVRDGVRASGETLLVLNPGLVPARAYFDLADVVVTFEGTYADYAGAMRRTPDWLRDLPRERVAHLVYGAGREQARRVVAEDPGAGYVYATDGALPDPWGALPAYLDEQESLLAACP